LGDLDGAAALYNQALPRLGPQDRYLALGHLGLIAKHYGEYDKAADYFRQAADIARGRDQDYYSNWLADLAVNLCDQARWAEAQRVNQQAFEASKTVQSALGEPWRILNDARIAAGQGNVQEAVRLYHHLFSTQSSDPEAVLEGSERLALLYAQNNQPVLARKQFKDALATADGRRGDLRADDNKLKYVDRLIDLHQQYVEFLAHRGDWEAAFYAAESSRARLMRERVGPAQTSTTQGRVADYQAAARAANATFLSYWIAPQESYLWVMDGTHPLMTITLCPESEIRALVERYHRP
jgi:ATP/maltotriose-dependent transcriptional regulator MalT